MSVNLYLVPGIAVVEAVPHRRPRDAHAFARRIACNPAAYLAVLIGLRVPGVVDLRPASHCNAAYVAAVKGGAL